MNATTRAHDNGRAVTRVRDGEYRAADFYRTERIGTASGRMDHDVYVGTIRLPDWGDDMCDIPSGDWQFSVSEDRARAGAYEIIGWIRSSSGGGWQALRDADDYGPDMLSGSFVSAAEAVAAITGR